jgi:LCP family protein required for cell wall assembly
MGRTSWVAVVIVILLGSVTGIAGGTFLAWWLPLARATHTGFGDLFSGPFGGKRYVRVLMIGEDDTAKSRKNGNGLSDTLVVVAIDTQTKEIRAISIPRDTQVEIPGHGVRKVNAAHVYGGPKLTRQVIQDLLGVNIDYYIKTNTKGLRGLVDLVGGVYIKVDKDMRYTDRRGGLYINLKASPNKQLLNGRQAEGFVRFRHDAFGDSGYRIVDGKKVNAGRIVRQQMFMRALANRILSLPTRRERAKVMQTAYERKYVVSDLNMVDWDGLADFFKDIKPEDIVMDVLPGSPGNEHGVSYWIPDHEAIRDLVAINLRFEGTPGQQVMAKVEVLNGSGIAGAATRVADKLKSAGFNVTRTSNADKFDYTRCCILAKQCKSEPVQRLAKLLRCNDIREDTLHDGIDATVIVGRDYNE